MNRFLAAACVVVAVSGCGVGTEAVVQGGSSTISYEQFLSRVVQEDTGEFVADGDTLFADESELKAFYNEHVAVPETQTVSQGLAIMTSGGQDVKWSTSQATNLTYCVSTKFGTTNYNKVVAAMDAAGKAWSAVAKVNFVHVTAQDSKCTASNSSVVFDVNPVNVNGQYLARSFFPNTTRRSRNVKIDNSSFGSLPTNLTLTGILRHELGHTLGFRHEHTRPEAGSGCFEDNNWRALTTYDSSSVMHYPQCNGTGDWSLTLTNRDAQGAVSVYPF